MYVELLGRVILNVSNKLGRVWAYDREGMNGYSQAKGCGDFLLEAGIYSSLNVLSQPIGVFF